MFHYIIINLFPFIVAKRANKKIDKNIKNIILDNNEINDNLLNIKVDRLKECYETSIKSKLILEDKLKQNIISITIVSTLMIGLLAIMSNGQINFKYNILDISVFIIAFFTFFYFILGGYISISTLANKNVVHRISIKDLTCSENILKMKYLYAYRNNNYENIKRNNDLYASYICIRNALILLMVLFVIIAFPKNLISNKYNKNYTKCYIVEVNKYVI